MHDAAFAAYAVRPAAIEDADAILAARRRAIRGSPAGLYAADELEAWARGGSADAIRRRIETTAAFVAVVGTRVVGWAALDGDEVDQLYVDPDHGGRGVARRLYAAIEVLAEARGAQQLTAIASLRAIPVFQRFGFTELRRSHRPFGGQSYEVGEMVKRLGPAA